MLVKKETVCRYLKRKCLEQITDKVRITNQTKILEAKYGIPREYSNDLLTLRSLFENEGNDILYCFVKLFEPEMVSHYFTETEINKYSEFKYSVKKIKFPLKFRMIQINEDQWSGTISVKEFMKLRDAQLIYYNENTQRQMKLVRDGDVEYYTIDLNKKSIAQITELLRTDNYIPDPITLNMPEDTWFSYDEGECELSIREIDHFDILDGYHRYIALSNLYNINKRFDYNMELRITCFSEGKAQQFIWQQDQKTKLKRIDSESMNQSNAGSQVIAKLNFDKAFDLCGSISRNDGLIDFASMAKLINEFYFREINKKEERIVIIKTANDLRDKINGLVAERPKLLEKKWNYKFLLSVVFCCANDMATIENVDKTYEILQAPEYKYLTKSQKLGKRDIGKIARSFEERRK